MKKRIISTMIIICILFTSLLKVIHVKGEGMHQPIDRYVVQSTDFDENGLLPYSETKEDDLSNFWIGLIIFAFGTFIAKKSKEDSQ